jgi:hypothetical protein
METVTTTTTLLDNANVIIIATISIISSIATILTMFIDESKVNKYVKPIVKGLNFLAGNVFKNKNATDIKK